MRLKALVGDVGEDIGAWESAPIEISGLTPATTFLDLQIVNTGSAINFSYWITGTDEEVEWLPIGTYGTGNGYVAANLKGFPDLFPYVTIEMGCSNQPAYIDGTSNYDDTIGAAYTEASTGQTIKMRSYEFSEVLNLNLDKIIKLQGGYDCDYVTNSGTYSTINGKLTIGGAGKVTVENIKIK